MPKAEVFYDTVDISGKEGAISEFAFLEQPLTSSKGYDKTNILRANCFEIRTDFRIDRITLACPAQGWWEGASFEFWMNGRLAIVASLPVLRRIGGAGYSPLVVSPDEFVRPVVRWAQPIYPGGDWQISLAVSGIVPDALEVASGSSDLMIVVLEGDEKTRALPQAEFQWGNASDAVSKPQYIQFPPVDTGRFIVGDAQLIPIGPEASPRLIKNPKYVPLETPKGRRFLFEKPDA